MLVNIVSNVCISIKKNAKKIVIAIMIMIMIIIIMVTIMILRG